MVFFLCEVRDMTANWIFNGGRLEARDDAGNLLRWWIATEALGRPFAELLGHSPELSRLLLWPLLERPEQPAASPA
jgi:hypothetical protein